MDVTGDTGVTDTGVLDTGDIEGGDLLPLAPALMAGGFALGGVYSVGKAYDNYRYWYDYYKNTGFRPRYPFRSREFDFYGDLGRTFYSASRFYRYR